MLDKGNMAFVFPGQGSQYVGMGRDLYEQNDAARAVFDEADETLGFSLSELCFSGPEGELRQGANAQPAILTASIAALRAMSDTADKRLISLPRFIAGHSVGEYSALVAAETMEFSEAVLLVRERGRLMREASRLRHGGMAAIIGLDKATIERICKETGAEIANINSDEQVVISGEDKALVLAMGISESMGARKVVLLGVSGAFHSSLMRPAVSGMDLALSKVVFRQPTVPVVSNLSGEPVHDIATLVGELKEQLYSCVQWSKSITYMASQGVRTFVEIGPGRVLAALVKRIVPSAYVLNVNGQVTLGEFQDQLFGRYRIPVPEGASLRG